MVSGIQIYLLKWSEKDSASIEALVSVLSESERQRFAQISHVRRRLEYVIGHVCSHLILRKTQATSSCLAHTHGLIALAVASIPIGIDIEISCRPIVDMLAVASRVFSPSEVLELKKFSGKFQQECFYKYWTRREARIKLGSTSSEVRQEQTLLIEDIVISVVYEGLEKELSVINIDTASLTQLYQVTT